MAHLIANRCLTLLQIVLVTLGILLFIMIVVPTLMLFGVFFFTAAWLETRQVWEQHKPTIVLEVGGINRGVTWKVGLNGINRDGYFGDGGNDNSRSNDLGLLLKPWRTDGEYILIAGQHDKSLQWQNMPPMSNWFLETYDEIRKYTQRPIIFRPHPRCRLA